MLITLIKCPTYFLSFVIEKKKNLKTKTHHRSSIDPNQLGNMVVVDIVDLVHLVRVVEPDR